MPTMYCALCRRPVEARRHIGAGTIFIGVITWGLGFLAIPFYAKRCSICRSSAVSPTLPDGAQAAPVAGAPARLIEAEHRLSVTQQELDATAAELDRVREERDFYRRLLDDPAARAKRARGDG